MLCIHECRDANHGYVDSCNIFVPIVVFRSREKRNIYFIAKENRESKVVGSKLVC